MLQTEMANKKGPAGPKGEKGDPGFFDSSEVIKMLERIEDKSDKQSETLASQNTKLEVITKQVEFTNGKVKTNCQNIDLLFKLNNDDSVKWAALFASINTWKYLSVVLGAMAAVISIVTFASKM